MSDLSAGECSTMQRRVSNIIN